MERVATDFNLWIALLMAVAGYLAGSVSFARIVHFRVTKADRWEPFKESVPHSGEVFESDIVSATAIGKKMGARYGCLVSLLDMAKVALPTLLVKLFVPGYPYFLLVALFGMAGHNFPVWHRFKGGRGESPLLGSLLVINWFGVLIANAGSAVLGFITGSVLVMRWGGYVLLIFWFWFYFKDPAYVVFMMLACLLYVISMRKDLARYQELKKRKGLQFSEEEISQFIMMGGAPGRFLDQYSLVALFKKWNSGR